MRKTQLSKDESVRIVLTDENERGLNGFYDPDDPKDMLLMEFWVELQIHGRSEEGDEVVWEKLEGTPRVTRVPAELPESYWDDTVRRIATRILPIFSGDYDEAFPEKLEAACDELAQMSRADWLELAWQFKGPTDEDHGDDDSGFPTKRQRTYRVDKVLELYGDGCEVGEETLYDLLTDIRHWCDREGKDYGELDDKAYKHYTEEK